MFTSYRRRRGCSDRLFDLRLVLRVSVQFSCVITLVAHISPTELWYERGLREEQKVPGALHITRYLCYEGSCLDDH